ncbi:hypothetical protein [Intrasporangium mesophilum]
MSHRIMTAAAAVIAAFSLSTVPTSGPGSSAAADHTYPVSGAGSSAAADHTYPVSGAGSSSSADRYIEDSRIRLVAPGVWGVGRGAVGR